MSIRIGRAITFLDQRSPTFHRSLTHLQASDLVVHLVEQRGDCGGAKSCLIVLGASGGVRYARVVIQSMQLCDALLLEVAHEIQHAVEVADDTRVVAARTSVTRCHVLGWGTAERCETPTAQAIGRQVLAEVHESAARRPAHLPTRGVLTLRSSRGTNN